MLRIAHLRPQTMSVTPADTIMTRAMHVRRSDSGSTRQGKRGNCRRYSRVIMRNFPSRRISQQNDEAQIDGVSLTAPRHNN